MIKRREIKPNRKEPSPEEIEAFAAGSDKDPNTTQLSEQLPILDPNAKRDFKAISVPFNEYEFSKLIEIADKTGRSKLNVIRWGIMQLSETLKDDGGLRKPRINSASIKTRTTAQSKTNRQDKLNKKENDVRTDSTNL